MTKKASLLALVIIGAIIIMSVLTGCTPEELEKLAQETASDTPSTSKSPAQGKKVTPSQKAAKSGDKDSAKAKKLVKKLVVREPVDDGHYERPKTWAPASQYHVSAPMSTCSIREYILYRDGKNVSLSNQCYPVRGTWTDPYTNTTYGVGGSKGEPVKVPRLQIDHIVPLKNAYMSGASKWTPNTFRTFAHDVNNLVTVYGSGNAAKGNKGPEAWVPENTSYHCTYATKWVLTKSEYNLSVNRAEKNKLTSMLATCS